MSSNRVILVGGGVRSGKSSFALALARRYGARRLFVATARAGDEEMRARIERHRRERGDDFETLEAPIDLAGTIRRAADHKVIVVDCLTLWLTNLLLEPNDPEVVLGRVDELIAELSRRQSSVILVTNEVGLGIVPESELGRTFRDLAGTAHQRLAREADEVYFAVLGTMLRLKPALAVVGVSEPEA